MTPHTLPSTPRSFFSPVVDSFIVCKPLVPESMFIDSINYRHFLLALRAHCNSYHTDIYIADSYLVVSTSMYRYVIGIADGDTRLFVNKVNREPYGGELVVTFRKGERRINIYTMKDEEVWGILGFKYNAVGEEIVIERTGAYRVQGDLVLEVADYKPAPLLNELANVQARLLLDLLLRVLTEMRVTVEVGAGDVILVPLFIPVKDAKTATKGLDGIREMVVERAATTLYGKLRELGLASEISKPLSWKAIIRADGDYRNCDIQVYDGDASHGYDALPYVRMNFVIAPKCSPILLGGTLLEEMYNDLQRLYQARAFEFTVGNHHVWMENAYSTTIRYKPKWKPLLLGDLAIEISAGQGWYHVTPKTVITIVHDEHGVVTVRFAKEYRVRFRSLNLAEAHDHERNAIALNFLDDFVS